MSSSFDSCRELAFSEPVVKQSRPLVAALTLRRYPKTVPSRAEHVKLRRDVRLLPGHVRIREGIRAAANGIKRVV